MRVRALPLTLAGAAAAGVGWAVRDYRAWRALGPGGLPPTWFGWCQTTRWRMAKADPFSPRLPARTGVDLTTLSDLPARSGPRPRVSPHPVPHRQLDGHAPARLRDAINGVFAGKIDADPVRLSEAISHFEKHLPAVTVRPTFRCHADACAACGEVGHVHPADGSMHMILSHSDARTVVERGWGERHGLAGRRLGLPATYTLIYAPRDERDLPIVSRILDAAIAYMLAPFPNAAPARGAD